MEVLPQQDWAIPFSLVIDDKDDDQGDLVIEQVGSYTGWPKSYVTEKQSNISVTSRAIARIITEIFDCFLVI